MDTERMPMTVQADWTGRRGERMCVCSCTIIMIPPALESLVKHEEQKLLIRSTLLDFTCLIFVFKITIPFSMIQITNA